MTNYLYISTKTYFVTDDNTVSLYINNQLVQTWGSNAVQDNSGNFIDDNSGNQIDG